MITTHQVFDRLRLLFEFFVSDHISFDLMVNDFNCGISNLILNLKIYYSFKSLYFTYCYQKLMELGEITVGLEDI